MGDQQQSRRIPGQQPASDQPDPGPGGISDAEYQEFLEFKKFQEWKRGERAADPTGPRPTATGTGRRPWWKPVLRVLRFKLVRRLLYLLLAILLLPYLLAWFLSGGSSSNSGSGSIPPDAASVAPARPLETVHGVFKYLRGPQPDQACMLFTPSGQAAFAQVHNAPDCAAAARALSSQITVPSEYATPGFNSDALQEANGKAVVHHCRVKISGGPELGSFELTQNNSGGWKITGYGFDDPLCR